MYWLAATLLLTASLGFPYVINIIVVRGLMGAMGNPSPNDKPMAPWAQRAKAAHYNAVENLVVFAPAVLAVQILGLGSQLTATACMVYFFARLAHYLVYTAGIPVLRTLTFAVGWSASAALILRVLGVL